MINANEDKQHERDHNIAIHVKKLGGENCEIIDREYLKTLEKLQQTVDNYTKEIWRLHQLEERLKKRIEALEEISQYEFAKGRVDSALDMQIDDLQKIAKGEGWTDKHTKIAKESDEKFKTHTKDQEVDI